MKKIQQVPFSDLDRYYPPGFLAYVAGDPEALSRYAFPPTEEGWRSAAEVRGTRNYPREELCRAILEGYRGDEFSGLERQNLERLRHSGTLAVVTGQQPMLLGGPLYVVFKALSAVRLARWATAELGVECVPIFWNHSDDHNVREVSWAGLVSRGNDYRRFEFDPPAEELPVHALPFAGGMAEAVESFCRNLPKTEFSAPLVELMGRSQEEGFSEWFTRLLRAWLGPLGLLVVEPRRLRQLGSELWRRELGDPEGGRRLLARVREQLRAMKRSPQLSTAGPPALWLDRGGRRRKLLPTPEGWRTEAGEEWKREEALERFHARPGELSPGVHLRPVLQDAVLPTLAYVGGPTEVAYFAEFKELYERHGVPMPVVMPRLSGTLVEPKIQKVMDKLELSPGELFEAGGGTGGEVVTRLFPESLEGRLRRGEEALLGKLEELGKTVLAVNAELRSAVERAQSKIEGALRGLRQKAFDAHKRSSETAQAQLAKLRTNLLPDGVLQERQVSLLPYLCLYGPALPEQLLESLEPFCFKHQLFFL